MGDRFESVKEHAVPIDLALRLLAGRAAEALTILRASGSRPPDFSSILRETAALLRPGGKRTATRQLNSLGQSADQIHLLLAALRAFPAEDERARELIATLDKAANDLDQLAGGEELSSERVAELLELLTRIRQALSTARARVPEELHLPTSL